MFQQALSQNPQAAFTSVIPLQFLPWLSLTQSFNPSNVVANGPPFVQQNILGGGSQVPWNMTNSLAAMTQSPGSNLLAQNASVGSNNMNAAMTSTLGMSSSGDNQQQQQQPLHQQSQSAAGVTSRQPVCLYLTCDEESLSAYQCLVRKQIELFQASREDVDSNAQGRNRPITLGQVGIRCRHCSFLPPKSRARGAIYYPAKLSGLYQAAQNMASAHLCEHCPQLPDQTRNDLLKLRQCKSSAGGGKKYWADGVRALGVVEDGDILRFAAG